MISDRLYELALTFRKAKLWNALHDDELFAVRHGDGTLGYCCVMGMLREHLALAVYPDAEGLASYRALHDLEDDEDSMASIEAALSQNCLKVSYENKADLSPRELREFDVYRNAHGIKLRGQFAFPRFERFEANRFPWPWIDERDQTRLCEALEAALFVAERVKDTPSDKLGFSFGAPYDRAIPLIEREGDTFTWGSLALGDPQPLAYASPTFTDELAIAKLQKIHKRTKEWQCSIGVFPEPISADGDELPLDELTQPPYYPCLLLIMDGGTGLMLNTHVARDLYDDANDYLQCVVETAAKSGKPRFIKVDDPRAYAFFQPIAALIDAKLELCESLPMLTEAKDGLIEHLHSQSSNRIPEELYDHLMEMAATPDFYQMLPDELLCVLREDIAQHGSKSPEIRRLILEECKRRGL